MVKNKKLFAVLLAFIILAVFCLIYYKNVYAEPYVYINDRYYKLSGASFDEDQIIEITGEIERNIGKGFWNKNGDTNAGFPVGTKIGYRDYGEGPQYALECGHVFEGQYFLILPED